MREKERERGKEIACVRMCVRVCICVYVWPCQSKRQRCSTQGLCMCVSACTCVCVCVRVARACPLSQTCMRARTLSVCLCARYWAYTFLLASDSPSTCPSGPSSSACVPPPSFSLSLSVTRAHAQTRNKHRTQEMLTMFLTILERINCNYVSTNSNTQIHAYARIHHSCRMFACICLCFPVRFWIKACS